MKKATVASRTPVAHLQNFNLQDLFIEINIINDLSDVMTSCSTTTKLTIILTRNDSELRKQAIKDK